MLLFLRSGKVLWVKTGSERNKSINFEASRLQKGSFLILEQSKCWKAPLSKKRRKRGRRLQFLQYFGYRMTFFILHHVTRLKRRKAFFFILFSTKTPLFSPEQAQPTPFPILKALPLHYQVTIDLLLHFLSQHPLFFFFFLYPLFHVFPVVSWYF